jgi:hypothetical protein
MNITLGQISLYFEYREADLDIDTASLASRRFEDYVLQLLVAKVKGAGREKHVQIALDIGLGPANSAIGKSGD